MDGGVEALLVFFCSGSMFAMLDCACLHLCLHKKSNLKVFANEVLMMGINYFNCVPCVPHDRFECTLFQL